MKKNYKKIIYIFSIIVLFSIIGGVVKYSLKYIDDKYLLTIYTKGAGKEKWFSNKIAQILKPLYGVQQTTNENLNIIFKYLDEVWR